MRLLNETQEPWPRDDRQIHEIPRLVPGVKSVMWPPYLQYLADVIGTDKTRGWKQLKVLAMNGGL